MGVACKCGRPLVLALEEVHGKCVYCHPVTLPVAAGSAVTLPMVDVTPLTDDTVMEITPSMLVTPPLTKEQRYRLRNPEKTKAANRARQQRHRTPGRA